MSRFKGMKSFLKRLFAAPWYPIVFSAYPVLALLAANIGWVKAGASIRPLIISIGAACILFAFLSLLLRNQHRAAFLLTLWLALFFSYGHVYNILSKRYPEFDFSLWLLIAWAILGMGAIFWAWKSAPSASGWNIIALGLVLVNLVWLGATSKSPGVYDFSLGAEYAPVQVDLVRPENPPDIYYFILDSYGREDLLLQSYGFDNSNFRLELEKRGFYVPKCSQSNYARTDISLASSLNMEYLEDLSESFRPGNTSVTMLFDSLKHSAVRYNLEKMGYETVNFASGYEFTELYDADYFLYPPPIFSGMTDFEGLILSTTIVRYAQNSGRLNPDYIEGVNFRDRYRYVFNSIDEIAKMPQLTFSYIHIISPHPPFVFDAKGDPTYPPDFWNDQRKYTGGLYKKGYLNQVQFLNKSMLKAIDTIFAESKTPPVIIIQGDHGPWLQKNPEHFWILNAYYLPGHEDKLYPTISPINTFRVVFNEYFGGKYDMLKDVSYKSTVHNPFDVSEVEYSCNNSGN